MVFFKDSVQMTMFLVTCILLCGIYTNATSTPITTTTDVTPADAPVETTALNTTTTAAPTTAPTMTPSTNTTNTTTTTPPTTTAAATTTSANSTTLAATTKPPTTIKASTTAGITTVNVTPTVTVMSTANETTTVNGTPTSNGANITTMSTSDGTDEPEITSNKTSIDAVTNTTSGVPVKTPSTDNSSSSTTLAASTVVTTISATTSAEQSCESSTTTTTEEPTTKITTTTTLAPVSNTTDTATTTGDTPTTTPSPSTTTTQAPSSTTTAPTTTQKADRKTTSGATGQSSITLTSNGTSTTTGSLNTSRTGTPTETVSETTTIPTTSTRLTTNTSNKPTKSGIIAPKSSPHAGTNNLPTDSTTTATTANSPITSSTDTQTSESVSLSTAVTSTDNPPTTQEPPSSQDPCVTSPCANGGTCVNSEGTAVCTCAPGYTGANCRTDIDDCTPMPCKNGASCKDLVNNYTCTCKPGYTSTNCTTDIDDCASGPCQHGGNCTDEVNSYTCACAPGYTGNECQTDIDDCAPNPCQHGGNCTDKVNSYTCTCAPGYTGGDCETDIDECASEPCQNNGTCTDDINQYACSCVDGFNGTLCENNIDDCVGDLCQNGGTCVDGINDYTCTCPAGWEDKNCTTNIDECAKGTDECHKNANCTDTEGWYNCTCKAGFQGDGRTCNDINECTNTSLCKNGADCFNTPGSYRCICSAGWTGADCSIDINECDSKPCAQHADCNNTNGSYDCTCQLGYRGDGHIKCIREVLFETSATFEHGDDNVMGPVTIPTDVYYYGKPYRTLYVSMNGYVTFGQKLAQKYPPTDSQAWDNLRFPVIAPLWSDIETTTEGSGFSYEVISDPTKLKEIQQALGLKQAVSQSIIVTWKQAAPYPVSQNGNQRADFQAVICNVGTQTLVVFNYDQERFSWTPSGDKHVLVGLSNKMFNGDIKFNSTNFAAVNQQGSSAIKGRWVFNVTADDSNWRNKIECTTALDMIPLPFWNTRSMLEACPCDERQVKLDRRFKHDVSVTTTKSYITRFSKGDAHAIQRCNYGASGYLLKGYPNGGYVDMKSNPAVTNAHTKCCGSNSPNCIMFYDKNPSDTCSTYRPTSWSTANFPLPIVASSWGDPHITTLDGLNYTFNGRGEYTLLKTNKTQSITVQVRTELFSKNNTDATVFVGVAIKVGNGEKLEILLDRKTEKVTVYRNGTNNGTFPGSSIDMEFGGLILFVENGKLIVLTDTGMSIQIGTGNILDIVVAAPNDATYSGSYGLLGNNNGDPLDDLRPASGTSPIDQSSSEKDIFKNFGQSWMITQEESLFTYNITGVTESYAYYNNKTIVPAIFIADIANMAANLTAYITEKCGTNINVTTCLGNPACLVDTAASCNISVGVASKESQENAAKEKMEFDHTPPVFGSPDPVYIGYSANKTLQFSFNIPNAVLTVSTNVTSYEFSNTSFSWNVTDSLRTSTMELSFVAVDDMMASSEYSPSIYYCGCEQEDQCDFSYISVDGPVNVKFYRARCNCPEFKLSDYCEINVDRCAAQTCFPGVSCNNSLTDVCGDCPKGYQGDGTKCYDDNECYTNTSGCQQLCTNLIGSYECSCRDGYYLTMDNHTCTDVDECLNATICSTATQYCNNIDGSFECLCRPGLSSNGNGSCYENKVSFAGVLVFEIKEDNITEIEKVLRQLLRDVFKNTVIDIVSINSGSTNSRRRRASTTNTFKRWKASYIIHEDKATNKTVNSMAKTLEDYLQTWPSDGGYVVPGNLNMKIDTTESKFYSDADGGVCNFPGKVECDEISTHCSSTNGVVTCSCKSGFDTWENPYTSCKDYDECQDKDKVCKSGTCTNTPGAFTCTCPGGYSYNGINECADLCQSNPCQNGGTCVHGEVENQYLCKCDDLWSGTKCEEKNSEAEKLKIIAIAVGASVGAICLILICLMCGMYRRHKHRYNGYASRPLSGLDFDTAYDLQPTTRTKTFPIDDSENTTFSIPRPQVTQNVYESAASSEIGKTDEPTKPLTESSKKDNDESHDNPSFLHSKSVEDTRRDSKRTSRNPYEYF